MPIKYNGQTISPAPLVAIDKSYIRDQGNDVLSPQINFTLTGTVLPYNVANPSMDDIVDKQKEIRDIFSAQDKELEIISPDSSSKSINAYCRVNSVSFGEGVWVQKAEYTINLFSNGIIGEESSSDKLQSKSENWSLQENGEIFNVSHSLEAIGLDYPGGDPAENARNWCRDNSYSVGAGGQLSSTSGTFDFNDFIAPVGDGTANYWNRSLRESAGPIRGSWSLQEDFVYHSGGNAIEEWSLDVNDDIGRSSINVKGNITGYAQEASDFETQYDNAYSHWLTVVSPNLISRVTPYVPSGLTLHPEPKSTRVTHDKDRGTLQYNYNYNVNLVNLVSGAVEENINISDQGGTDVFAKYDIPGRPYGPFYQNLNTKSSRTRTVSLNATIKPSGEINLSNINSNYLSKPDTSNIINAVSPVGGGLNGFISQNDETWNPATGKYSRTVQWEIQGSGLASGSPSGV